MKQLSVEVGGAGGALLERIVGILEQAQAAAVRTINSQMVLAYWMIGREIVQEVQSGKERSMGVR